MRDPERIPLLLEALERKWREVPDLRLGQLLVNLTRLNTGVDPDEEARRLFNLEDEDLLRMLDPESADAGRSLFVRDTSFFRPPDDDG